MLMHETILIVDSVFMFSHAVSAVLYDSGTIWFSDFELPKYFLGQQVFPKKKQFLNL